MGKKRWSSWKVEVEKGQAGALDLPIAGTYRLLEKCGGPMNALHRRVVSTENGDDSEAAGDGMFLFQDPTRCGEAKDDGFVFAQRWRRLAYGEERGSIARLDTTWRPTDDKGVQTVACTTLGRWVDAPVRFTAVACNGATVAIPTKPLLVKANTEDSCASAVAVLECTVPLPKDATAHGWVEGDDGEWQDIPLQRSKAKFESIAWFTERLALPPTLREWAPVASGSDGAHTCLDKSCARCAPAMPQLQFVTVGKQVEAREDVRQAGEYEQALKRRPAAFVVRSSFRTLENPHNALRIRWTTNCLDPQAAKSASSTFHALFVNGLACVWRSLRQTRHLLDTVAPRASPCCRCSRRRAAVRALCVSVSMRRR